MKNLKRNISSLAGPMTPNMAGERAQPRKANDQLII